MRRDVHDALASAFDTRRIVRQLHDVPPHEVYEIYVNGQHAVYKGDIGPTGNAATEGSVIAFVDAQTSVAVPRMLEVGDAHYIAAWHPDAPPSDKGGEVDETWASVAGRGLAILHDETDRLIDTYGQFQPRNSDISITGDDDWHTAAIEYVRHHRAVPDRHGHGDIVDTVIEFLTEHPNLFAGAGSPVCCHGWATPEHVSVTDDQVSCMVDFEHAIAAPGEFDYWRTVLPTFMHDTTDLEQTFRDGYESIRPFPAGFERRKPFYMLLHLIYFFESLYVQDQHGPEETADRAKWIRDEIIEIVDSHS
jgi:hypothetical protein